jgi:hypothetical protein
MSILVILIGGLLIYLAKQAKKKAEWKSANWITVTGEVIDLEESYGNTVGNGSKTVFTPIVNFKTEQDQDITFNSGNGSSLEIYKMFQAVEVVYNPQNPNQAEIKGDSIAHLGNVIYLILGWGLTGVGIIALPIEILLRFSSQ